MQFGPDHARAALAADAPDLALELLALGAELAEAGGEDHGALDLVGDALLDEVEDAPRSGVSRMARSISSGTALMLG